MQRKSRKCSTEALVDVLSCQILILMKATFILPVTPVPPLQAALGDELQIKRLNNSLISINQRVTERFGLAAMISFISGDPLESIHTCKNIKAPICQWDCNERQQSPQAFITGCHHALGSTRDG